MASYDNQGPSEINPRPIRVIQTMGESTFIDWIWFGCFAIFAFPFLVWKIFPEPSFATGIWEYVIRIIYVSPFLIAGAVMGFVQSRTKGKLRWRMIRGFKFTFGRKILTPLETTWLYQIKEIKNNHLHYSAFDSEGVLSVYRLEGFDPSLLSGPQIENIVNNLTNFFGVNIRFKLISTRVNYTIPAKKIANQEDFYGLNFARNRYQDRIADLNKSADLRQQAYFIIIDGISISKNDENMNLVTAPLSDAHLNIRSAIPEEISQVFNEIWGGGFDYNNPSDKMVQSIVQDKTLIKFSKHDGTHKYVSFLSYNSIPESASLGWLGKIFNTDHFSLIMDIAPMSPEESSKYLEKINTTADSLMQTNWFKRRARDQERIKISHVKDVANRVTHEIANGDVGMKEVCFYLIFSDNTRKGLKKKISDFQRQLSVYNDGWALFDCKYLQKEALINTRLYDVPTLQYHSANNIGKKDYIAHHEMKHRAGSSIHKISLSSTIDHKILTTSLGLSYPFYAKASIADSSTWFKGFQIDAASGDLDPYFADYWKKNEQYNSFNRFYQGRNGSGKSYTADIDMVCDRLDDKFIISIDPKPERVLMTKNLGGQNLLIGANNASASYINIFDVLVASGTNSERQNPLTAQYQANLTSMAILLSLDVNLPTDKIVLSCFNDVQVHVYENIKKINVKSNFYKIPPNAFPLMRDFYETAIEFYRKEHVPETKAAYNKLIVLMKEHAVGISAPIFNNYSNVDWSKNRMWNLIVRDIALNFGNKNILACWTINIIRVASAFLYANQKVVLYIDELHLIHNIDGVLQRLDEYARVDRSFSGALCLINQNFNSIRGTSDPKKKEYYESIFTMSQYNMFFTTGEEDVEFLVDMLEGSGEPLSPSERNFVTRAGRGKALLVMNAYDRYRVQFDISFWQEVWETDLENLFKQSEEKVRQQEFAEQQQANAPITIPVQPGYGNIEKAEESNYLAEPAPDAQMNTFLEPIAPNAYNVKHTAPEQPEDKTKGAKK